MTKETVQICATLWFLKFFVFVLEVIARSISCWVFVKYRQLIYDYTFFLCYPRSHYVNVVRSNGGTHYNIDCVLTGAAMWYDFNAVLSIQVFVIELRWCYAVKILIPSIRMAERAFGFQSNWERRSALVHWIGSVVTKPPKKGCELCWLGSYFKPCLKI